MKKIDFVTLLKNYDSGWVGISADFKKVLLSGKTLKDIMKKTKDFKEKVYFFPVEKSYSSFIG